MLRAYLVIVDETVARRFCAVSVEEACDWMVDQLGPDWRERGYSLAVEPLLGE